MSACGRCGGDGFVTAPPLELGNMRYPQLAPCPVCSLGAERRSAIRAAAAANDAEIDRLGYRRPDDGSTTGPPPRPEPLL